MQYRIMSGRWDVSDSVCKEFEAENDDEARRIFDEIAREQAHAWDSMQLFRIDQPEILTYISSVRVR